MLEELISGGDHEKRMKERDKILNEEQNIDKWQYEAAAEEIMDDYMPKEYANIDEIEAADAVEHDPLIPCNYYENEDGFWDDYIDWKQNRWQEAGMITNRKFYKH